MPSPRSRRPLDPVAGRFAAALGVLAVAVAVHACASSAPPPIPAPAPVPRGLDLPAEEKAFLVEPLAGFPGAIDPARHEEILSAHRNLLAAGDLAGAGQLAAELLADDPSSLPAAVLAAQVDFARGDVRAVIKRLVPVGDAAPGYTASQLLLGRAAERSGDVALAYAAYRAVAAKSPLAFAKTGALHAQALETVRKRLQVELEQGETEAAQGQLKLLQAWGPSELSTYEAAAAVARATGDRAAELAAVRSLSERRPDDRALLEHRADLEMDVGDPSRGLDIVQKLADRNRKDPALATKLEGTKFRWRLSFLPPDVREIAGRPSLSRADLAVLLYWLIPSVRYAKPTAGLIAVDVLDQPRQEEIVRVVNLGLMDVDRDLHRFSPGSPARRGTALGALTRLLSRFGGGLACLQGESGGVCAVAARCGLFAATDECRPRDPVAGPEAVEMIRLAEKLLGAS